MITFTVLCLIAIALMVIAIVLLTTGGVAFAVVFGDLIVCVFLIGLLIKFAFGSNKKKKN